MPRQELYFDQQNGDRKIEVLKSWDQKYAHEVLQSMGDIAMKHLWTSINPEAMYEPADLPSLELDRSEAEDFLWEELLEQAREDGNLLSFFVVSRTEAGKTTDLYVSPDWPSAEAFAVSSLDASPA